MLNTLMGCGVAPASCAKYRRGQAHCLMLLVKTLSSLDWFQLATQARAQTQAIGITQGKKFDANMGTS